MAENYQNDAPATEAEPSTEFGLEIIRWEIPEYHKHDRGHWWYLLYAIIGIGLVVQALIYANFLFALIIVIGSLAVIVSDARHPQHIPVIITTEGVLVGSSFYDYDSIKHFAVIYKPNDSIKRIYFIFKSTIRHRLSVALADTNPLVVREQLIKYIPEDLERTDEPLSEFLGRLLKL